MEQNAPNSETNRYNPEPPNVHPSTNPRLANYKFSPDELRVMKECNRESFYFRSLPFGTILGTLTYYAVKGGYLKPSNKLGPIPKVFGAIGVGYILGKISYQDRCMEKIMALPNSQLAEALRQRKGRPSMIQDLPSEGEFSGLSADSGDSSQRSDSLHEMRALDMSFDAPPRLAGLDDSSRPTVDSSVSEESPLPQPRSFTSYDELRRRNRDDYEQKRLGSATKPASPPYPSPSISPTISEEDTPSAIRPTPRNPVKKNTYGDVWEE